MKHFFEEIIRGKSIGRAMVFERLKLLFREENWLNNQFRVLELGSEPASHQRALPEKWRIESSNYKSANGINYLVDIEKKFPFFDKEFDGTIFFNVLYLADDYENCLREALRISDKFLLFNVPLISGLAPHPVDLNRFTEGGMIKILEKFRQQFGFDYSIMSIGGTFSSAVSLIDPYLKFRIIKAPVYVLALWADRLDKMFGHQCPTQYLVFIKKLE